MFIYIWTKWVSAELSLWIQISHTWKTIHHFATVFLFKWTLLVFVQRTDTVGKRGEPFCDSWAVTSTPSMPGLPLSSPSGTPVGRWSARTASFRSPARYFLLSSWYSLETALSGTQTKNRNHFHQKLQTLSIPFKNCLRQHLAPFNTTEAVAVCFVEDLFL